MENLKYYLEIDCNGLLAYDAATDFFAIYDESVNQWRLCGFSFAQFKHDRNYKSTTCAEAKRLSNGNLPEALYAEHIDIVNANRNAT